MKNQTPRYLKLVALCCIASLTLPVIGQNETDPNRPNAIDPNRPRDGSVKPAPVTSIDGTSTPNKFLPTDPNKPRDPNLKAAAAPTQTYSATPLDRKGQKWAHMLNACGDYQVAISKQASTQASNAQVRAFAANILADHEAMSADLRAMAMSKRVTADNDHAKKHQDDVADLGKKTGKAYDEAYLEDVIDGHEDAIAKLEKGSKSEDADVAAFSIRYIPTLRDHLARAKQLDKAID
jgi:putative membrane protein